jgi:hypothetical protein
MESTHVPLDQYNIRFNTSMSSQRTKNTLERAAKCLNDTERAQRLKKLECKGCYYFSTGFGGQAFTTWYCGICAKEDKHANTNTPKVCKDCAKKHKICRRCGGDINMSHRRRKFPTPAPKVVKPKEPWREYHTYDYPG